MKLRSIIFVVVISVSSKAGMLVIYNQTEQPITITYDYGFRQAVNLREWDVAALADSPNLLDHGFLIGWNVETTVVQAKSSVRLYDGDEKYVQNLRFDLPLGKFQVVDSRGTVYTREKIRGLRFGKRLGFIENFECLIKYSNE